MESWSPLWLQCHRRAFWCNLCLLWCFFFLVGLWLFGFFWLERFDKSDTRSWVILIKCNIWFRQKSCTPSSRNEKSVVLGWTGGKEEHTETLQTPSNLSVVEGLPNPEVLSVCQDIPSLWLYPGSPGPPITFWRPQHPETGTSTAEPCLGFKPAISAFTWCPFFFLQRKTEWAVDTLWLSPCLLSWF